MRLTPAQRLNPAAWLLLPLLRRWNHRRNPTRDFPAARVTRLALASDGARESAREATLRFGGHIDDIAALGPADWYDSAGMFTGFYYYRLGAIVRLGGGRVATVQLLCDPAASPLGASHEFVPGSVELLRGGRVLASFGAGVTESQLNAALGKPDYSEDIGKRRMAEYRCGKLEVEAEVDIATRRVVSLSIGPRDDE